MKIIIGLEELRERIREERSGRRLALVPTMGYLHEGHMELVRNAHQDGSLVVLSIFVNPLQFGPAEDYGRYPRDLERDTKMADEAGVDILFCPTVDEMYPGLGLARVEVEKLDKALCGRSRPGHFTGVATVVAKLFNIVQPDQAYFGLKDYQQYLIITQMVQELNFPVEVRGVPIVREADGLALSSRNVYLTATQRAEAPVLFASLMEAEQSIRQGERSANVVRQRIIERIMTETSGEIDYVEVCRADNLERVEEIGATVLLAVAVRFGTTRLIDNKVVEV